MADFMHGAYYPEGGSKTIASSAAHVIESQGGECLVNHPVSKIIIERGRAVGVEVIHKGQTKRYFAPTIVSNAGAFTTFSKLLPAGQAPREQQQLQQTQLGPSTIILFLGLKDDPRNVGFDDSNYWVYDNLDASAPKLGDREHVTQIQGTFLSFGSLRNPGQNHHTAQLISFSEYDLWQKFAGTAWLKRGPEYEDLKERVADAMIDFACGKFPQLRGLIAYRELSTPLSVETFTAHRAGMVYGQACTPERLFTNAWKTTTSVPGLYLTGSDVGLPGVNGAMMAGVMTAAKIIGLFGFPRIFTAAYTR
jgi:phytoene dehydrogenase-like protein